MSRYIGVVGLAFGTAGFIVYAKAVFRMAEELQYETDVNEVASALLHYYLMGTVLFAVIYFNIHQLDGSICDNDAPLEGIKGVLQCFYFSVVTATTTGYGDVVAKGFLSRLFALLQISFGPVFLFVLFSIAFHRKKDSSRR